MPWRKIETEKWNTSPAFCALAESNGDGQDQKMAGMDKIKGWETKK